MERKVIIMDHPLIQHKLSILRDVKTSTKEFRDLVNEIAMLMIYELVPSARIGHIGLYRDETTLQPVEYYCKLPKDIEERDVFVVDPMLATGGSAIDAISQIKKRNPRSIKFLCIIAAPEGLEALEKAHPDVDIFAAGMDERLNENGYIVPGLGDAGDRIFGTK